MTSVSMYDTDYEMIEQPIESNKFEFNCNTENKNVIGLLIRFTNEYSRVIDANEKSTLLIQNIKDGEVIPRFYDNKPKEKELFTKLECFFSRIDSSKKYWIYFINDKNNYEIKLIFDLYFDKDIENKFLEVILIYNRIFSDRISNIKFTYYPSPALCYYLVDTDLKQLVSFT